MQRVAQILYLGVLLVASYILFQWVVTSFSISENGPIKWEEGWNKTRCEIINQCIEG